MSIATIGLNVRRQFVRDVNGLKADVRRIGGGVLEMDGSDLFGETTGARVFRRWQERDKELYTFMSPEQWVASCPVIFGGDVYHQCHNEPYVTAANVDAFVDWDVRMLSIPQRLRQAVGTFAVGNPHESLITGRRFDRMLTALNETDALMLHEYFRSDPVPEVPWWTGRIIYWLERMAALNTRCKTIIIGEYGRDFGGAARDGWRNQGWSANQYADKLIAGMRDIYAPLAKRFGVRIHVFVYAVGNAGANDQWASFDVEGESDIYDAMNKWNEAQMTLPIPVEDTTTRQGVVTKTAADLVNIRSSATVSSPVMGELRVGQAVTYNGTAIDSLGRKWRRIFAPVAGYTADWLLTITENALVETNKVALPIPFVSQLGNDANLRNNDCGIAAALMAWRYMLQQVHVPYPPAVTVDALVEKSPLASGDNTIDTSILANFMNTGLKMNAARVTGLTVPAIRQHLANGDVVIPLVAYRDILPADTFDGGHFGAVAAVSDQYVWFNDPYRGGELMRFSHTQFDAALKDVVAVGASTSAYVGVVAYIA